MKLTIVQKGLAFLLLPLLLQIIFFWQLSRSMERSEQLSQDTARLGTLITILDTMSLESFNLWNRFGSGMLKNEHAKEEDTGILKERMRASIKQIEELERAHPQEDLKTILQSGRAIAEIQDEIITQMNDMPTEGSIATKMISMLRLRPLGEKLVEAMKQLKVLETQQLAALQVARAQEAASRETMKQQLLTGVIVDAAIIIALLSYFLRSISSRLGIVMRNASLIPTGKAMTESVAGNDELSYLDQILRQASSDLRQAAEHRKSVTNMLAHDLRAPLNSVSLTIESLVAGGGNQLNDNARARVLEIRHNVSSVTNLVEDLLTVEKLESGKLDLQLELLHVKQVIAESISLVSAQAQAKSIELNRECDDISVVADRRRIVQVLTNLLSNAIKFSPSGSFVTIKAANQPNKTIVSVIDRGPGINLEQQARLFDKFQQVDGKAGGFGLGLSIAKLLVDKHGGSIGVTSEPGKGTTVWFTLPIDDEE